LIAIVFSICLGRRPNVTFISLVDDIDELGHLFHGWLSTFWMNALTQGIEGIREWIHHPRLK
jgi:hypothetical protein